MVSRQKNEIERTSEGLPITVTETYRYYDVFSQAMEEVTITNQYEFESNGLITSVSILVESQGDSVPVGTILFTYSGNPLKIDTYTEITISGNSESMSTLYDTLSSNFLYEGDTVRVELIDGQDDTTRVTAYEGDTLIIEIKETFEEEDPETGNPISILEHSRETFPTIGTLTAYFNLMATLFWEDQTPVMVEEFDTDIEDFVMTDRLTSSTTADTTFFIQESWDSESETWVKSYETKVTFDENGKMTKRDIIEYYGEFTGYYQDLINPTAEFMQFVSTEEEAQIPSAILLHQNYPNPFNPSTQLSFDLREAGMVTLEVFDVTGRKVATLLNQPLGAGTHSVNFDATDLASGVYLSRLQFVAAGRANGPAFGQTAANATVTQHRLMTLLK